MKYITLFKFVNTLFVNLPVKYQKFDKKELFKPQRARNGAYIITDYLIKGIIVRAIPKTKVFS